MTKQISDLTAKNPPVDADIFPLDDGSTGVTYKVTWANVKATLKTYFDTLYQAALTAANFGSFISSLTADSSPDAAADYVVTYDASASAAKKVLLSAIGGGWTVTSASVTTSNVTGVEGTLHNLDVSGMTANRDFSLPTPSAAGVRCGVRLSVGDATYALLLKANSVEITRIFITEEIMIFVATGTGAGDWALEVNGRIPGVARLKHTSAQTLTTGVGAYLNLGTSVFDNCSMADTSNNRLNIRRSSKYLISGGFFSNNLSADAVHVYLAILDSAANQLASMSFPGKAGGFAAPAVNTTINLSAGDYVKLYALQNSGLDQNTYADYTHLEIVEVPNA